MMVNDLWAAARPPGASPPLPRPVRRWWALWAVSGALSLPAQADGVWSHLAPVAFLFLIASAPDALRTVRILTDCALRLRETPVVPDPATAWA
jgi:hypothetical protein